MFFGWKPATPAIRLSVAARSGVSLRSCGHRGGGCCLIVGETSRQVLWDLPVDVGEADMKVLIAKIGRGSPLAVIEDGLSNVVRMGTSGRLELPQRIDQCFNTRQE